MYWSILGAELCANEIRKRWFTKVVPESSCTQQQVRSMILDYELCVYFTVSSQLDFCRESIYYPLPGSIPSPNRHPCTNASDQAARLELRNQTSACAVVLVDVVDCQSLISIRIERSAAFTQCKGLKTRSQRSHALIPSRGPGAPRPHGPVLDPNRAEGGRQFFPKCTTTSSP